VSLQIPAVIFTVDRGPKYAAEFLGYDPVELESLPSYGNVKGKYSSKFRVQGVNVLPANCGHKKDNFEKLRER
jgi:hypothetical protein